MSNSKTGDFTITRGMVNVRHIIYLFILMANFIYVLVLYAISVGPTTRTPTGDTGITVDMMFFFLVILAVVVFIINQRILIPRANSIEEPFNRFATHLIILVLGIEGSSMYGLVIGFISLEATNSINWLYVGVLVLWSFIYGVYFYFFYYQPTLAEIEVGKTLPRRTR